MHVCLTHLWYPADARDPDALIDADVTRRGFGGALAARGHRVTVVREAPWRATVVRDGVTWELVPPSAFTRASRRTIGALGHPWPIVPAPATALVPVVEALRPDVIHSFDLALYPSLALLGGAARRLGVPLVAHFHGGAPARNPAWRAIERLALARADRLLFTTRAHGRAWVASGALPDEARIVELFETSTFLRAPVDPAGRAAARARTGLDGLVFLCPGRLDAVKDPLTTLAGFARVAAARPEARLVMVWNSGELEVEVRRIVANDPVLAPRVELRGAVPHGHMADLYASADVVLQSSVREVCGVAIVEALACGVAPVVPDIPAFRRLTDGGRVGRLFPRGDAVALAAQALALLDAPVPRADVRGWFERALSFEVLAAELEGIYAAARG